MTFSFQCSAISPTPRGQTRGQTLLFALPFAIENLPGVRILMSKPCRFPCTAGTLEKYLPCTKTRLSPSGQWLQITGASVNGYAHYNLSLVIILQFTFSFQAALQQMSLCVRKPTICLCENKDADQLRGNHEADQRLCFRYTDSTVPLLLKSKISSL